MTDLNTISVYANDEKRNRIQREADAADMSMSRYILSVLEEKWTDEDTEEVSQEARVEERVERITSKAADEIEAMVERQEQRTEQMADMAARSAVYSIANFELLKYTQKPPEAARTKSLQIGARRLRDPFDLEADADATVDLAIETDDSVEQDEQEAESTGLDDDFFKKHS